MIASYLIWDLAFEFFLNVYAMHILDASIVDVPHEEVFEETFASRLAQMEQMGFMDKRENIKALFRSDGDVNKAVERLLEKQNPEG